MKDSLLNEILKLPLSDRIWLLEEVWESIEADQAELELTAAQREELEKRLAAYQAAPSEGFTWEEVQAKVREP